MRIATCQSNPSMSKAKLSETQESPPSAGQDMANASHQAAKAEPHSMLTLVEQINLLPLASAAWALNGPLVCCNSRATRPASPARSAVAPAQHAAPSRIPGQEHGERLASPTCTSGKRKRSFHARPSARMAAWASTSSSRPMHAAYSPAAFRGEPSSRVGFNPTGRRRCMTEAKAECARKFSSPKLPSASECQHVLAHY